MLLKWCPDCKTKAVMSSDIKFCGKCGKKLVALPKCKCGNQFPLDTDDKYCTFCGTPREKVEKAG